MNKITIELELIDDSVQQMAYGICKYYLKGNCYNIEPTVIDLEEFAEHILAYTRAERKMLEVNSRD